MDIMRTMIYSVWLMLLLVHTSNAQLETIEYFINDDPGLGNGTPVAIAATADATVNINNIDISNLPNGIHSISVRSKDSNGVWSLTQRQLFYKHQTPLSNPIVAVEYFFGNDPGYGNGTSSSIASANNISDLSIAINTAGLDNGAHLLSIRTKNQQGQWSMINQQMIFKNAIANSNITKLEYFFGNDPGYDNGTTINVTPSSDINNFTASINTASLSDGMHVLSIRSKDQQGKWSLINQQMVLKNTTTSPNISKLEYFFGNDPGYDNGTTINVTPSSDINNFTASINTASLSDGMHVLSIRSKDQQGKWSLINQHMVLKNSKTVQQITQLEYFFGNDPGYGNGVAINVVPNSDIVDLSGVIDASALNDGIHKLSIRSKDQEGKWSLLNQYAIHLRNGNIGAIDKLEYYIDTDPGIGQGTTVSVANNLISSPDHIIPITAQTEGIHTIGVRTHNDMGKWSITNTQVFLQKDSTRQPIVRAEYFIDTDPGIGQATQITMPALIDIADHNFMVIGPASNDTFDLYVRVRTQDNTWSLTHIVREIEADNVALPLVWASFDAKAVGDQAHLNWKVSDEINTSHFEVQRQAQNAFESIGRVESKQKTELTRYSYIDLEPHSGYNHYRILQYDTDGRYTSSEIKAVYFDKNEEISIYPNPTTESIHINVAEYRYSIFDASGSLVRAGKANQNTIDCSELSDGIYRLQLELPSGVRKVLTFVKM